ncbi:relaxase/mobilization nuclease domain-containing protein [Methylorubrum rhodesianum]|uniref:relaxase/mobilization nuclease domain-containing protein n=1 Tax=Methylorubrum rhodesianum TaxID=29427 RepID=UPI003CFFD98E
MISGAMRGQGEGDALARHLMKPENDEVVVIPARGLGSPDIRGQIQELRALSLGGRTDRPIYHLHVDPEDAIQDNAGARARWWALFEAEFGLASHPYCGVEHFKKDRRHEHRVYSLVRPDGRVVDLAHDFARREKVSRVVEFEFGMPAPTPSKHARAIVKALREQGRDDVAAWMVASGTTEAARPVARLSPQERLIEERTGVPLDDLRSAALAAWRESADGPAFLAALRARGLDLREGRSGPVVVDGTGTAHLATRLVGAAARRQDGARIPAAAVKERLAGLTLTAHGDGHDGRQAGRDPHRDPGRQAAPGSAGGGVGARGDAGGAEHAGGAPGAHDGGGRHGERGVGDALDRLAARPRAALLRGRLRLMSPASNRALAEALDGVRARTWIAVPGMATDIWGLPIQGERPRLG